MSKYKERKVIEDDMAHKDEHYYEYKPHQNKICVCVCIIYGACYAMTHQNGFFKKPNLICKYY